MLTPRAIMKYFMVTLIVTFLLYLYWSGKNDGVPLIYSNGSLQATVDHQEYIRILDEPFLPFNLSVRADTVPKNCSPKLKLIFVKTRKTASTTLQNILLRYGYNAGLNIVVPNQGHKIIRDKVLATPWNSAIMARGGYDIWASHTDIWNPNLMTELVGDDDVLRVTILRDPSAVFESGYLYFKLQQSSTKGLHYLLKKLEDGNITDMGWKSKNSMFGLNFKMVKDFGFPRQDLNDSTLVLAKIHELDNFFDLVLVSEMMEESLVLLADLMCLPLHHFVALQKNSRKEGNKNSLSEHERNILKTFQVADEMLYKHFRDKLNKRIDAFGWKRMQDSVDELKRLSQEITSTCILGHQDNINTQGTKYHEFFNNIVVYRVREDIEECKLMGYSEIGIFEMLREHERKRHLEVA